MFSECALLCYMLSRFLYVANYMPLRLQTIRSGTAQHLFSIIIEASFLTCLQISLTDISSYSVVFFWWFA